MKKKLNSSWEDSAKWYDRVVGEKGHYYHQRVIFPNLLRMMELDQSSSLVDLGCGQGILSRQISSSIPYLGIDVSASLIQFAKQRVKGRLRKFVEADLCQPLKMSPSSFTHATMILSLQNMEDPLRPLLNAAHLLKPEGRLFIVLNHPCFRIPRQSSWGIDEKKHIQYRRIDRYLSPLKISIQTHPGKKKQSEETWSFHLSLSAYSKALSEAGFAIGEMEEWCSDKKSTGSKAQMEDLSRQEFPLFLAIRAFRVAL